MELWNHQRRGLAAWTDCYDRGVRRVCLTSPTGGGKTAIIFEIIKAVAGLGRRVALYSNRKILISQIVNDLIDARIPHGVRASGYEHDLDAAVQICSVQTEVRRVLKDKRWNLHAGGPGDVAIFDEGHLHTNGHVLRLRKMHLAGGANTLDVTATPLGMGTVCDELIVAGNNTELRSCGALILADHYAPDEPDWLALKKPPAEGEDLSENQQRDIMGKVKDGKPSANLVSLIGRIWPHYERLNPDRRPAILFAPGVHESIWFAQQFTAKGVRSAHVDGEHIWLDQELHRKTEALWEEVLAGSRDGSIKVLCNRFVLREGVNAPWLAFGILATVFGSVQSYLQAGGRLLRADAGLDHVTMLDHGGNYWRHGSLNVDRVWSLGDTASSVFHKRADRIRDKRNKAPIVCPKCSQVLTRRTCPCGYEIKIDKLPRPVATADGKLRLSKADYFPARRQTKDRSLIGHWIITWKRACSVKWYATFRQAEADFARNHDGLYPDRTWPLFPIAEDDLYRRVLEVPTDRLRGNPELLAELGTYQRNQLAKLERLNDDDRDEEEAGQEAPAEGAPEDGPGQEREGRKSG